jgi:mannose-6-phosphate isomerase-like protein (cupin superfamily)
VRIVTPTDQTVEEWRPGVRTRLLVSAATGAQSLCVFEQWSEPGRGAPTHTHFDVEEVILVVDGRAEVWIDGETTVLERGGTALVPPHALHGFRNAGTEVLHTLTALPDAAPRVRYEDSGEVMTIGLADGGMHRKRASR